MDYVDELLMAEQRACQTRQAYEAAVTNARKMVEQTVLAHEKRIRSLVVTMEKVRNPSKVVARFGNLVLYPDCVTNGSKTFAIDQVTNASMESRGSSFLVITSSTGRMTTPVPEGRESQACAFSDAVYGQMLRAPQESEEREERLAELQKELDAAIADTSAIQQAQAFAAAVQADTSAVMAADSALANLQASVPPEMMRSIKLVKRGKMLKKVAFVLALVMAALVLISIVVLMASLL